MGGDIGGARSEMEAMGIEIVNASGDMNTMESVIEQLVDKGWHEMTSAQKQNIAQTIAGNRHYVRFIKLMENQARATDLASDALNDIDSAAGQAEKAMESFAYRLESAEAAGENLKANLGESLSPFLIGQQKARNDLLEMQTIFADIFGEGFLEAMGRMTTFMQHAGGFIKFGLGIQSLAIGMSMFDSVQRDLHGILIANETLHSKQATFFDFNVQATENEKVILKGIQHAHQVINKHRERSMALQQKINHLQTTHKSQFEEQNRLEEYRLNLGKQSEKAAIELNSLSSMYNVIAKQGSGNRMERVMYFNQQLVAQGSEMTLQKQSNKLFNEKSAAQEAHMRRVVIQHDEVARLSNEDIAHVEQKNRLLKQQTDDINRLLQAEQIGDTLREGTFQRTSRRDTGQNVGQMNAAAATLKVLNHAMNENEVNLREMIELQNKLEQSNQELSEPQQIKLNGYKDEARMYKELKTSLTEYNDGTKDRLVLDDQTRAALHRLGETTLGFQMQTDTLLKTVDLHGMMMQRQIDLTSALNTIENESKLTKREMLDIIHELGPVNQQLTDFTDELKQSQDELNDSTDRRIQLEEILKNGLADTAKETKVLKKKLAEDGLIEANVKASDSSRKFGFALSSVASVALPMFSQNANGAVAATVMMSTTLIPAISQLGKTTWDFIKFQRELIAANKAAGLSWTAYAGKLMTSLGPLAAVTTALMIFNKGQEEVANATAAANKMLDMHNETMLLLKTNTHLFTDENSHLAEKLGITNYSLKNLHGNADDLDYVMEALSTEIDGLDASQEDAIDSALRLADALHAVSIAGGGVVDEAQLEISFNELDAMFDGAYDEFGNFMDEQVALQLGFSQDRVAAAEKLEGVFSDDAIEMGRMGGDWLGYDIADVDFEIILDELKEMFKKGERLTDKEMTALVTLFGAFGSEAVKTIKILNDAVITPSTADSLWVELEESIDPIIEASRELQNLTESMYDFGDAREELFFGGKYGNVTGSLYKQVVKQGVGVLYNKMDIVMSNNFHGFFNEREAADRIIAVLNEVAPSLTATG